MRLTSELNFDGKMAGDHSLIYTGKKGRVILMPVSRQVPRWAMYAQLVTSGKVILAVVLYVTWPSYALGLPATAEGSMNIAISVLLG